MNFYRGCVLLFSLILFAALSACALLPTPLPPAELFPFYADASNLERITPDLLRFRLLTPTPIELGVGTRIDYALRVHGVPIRWTSEITAWDPPFRFRDEQLRGPYSVWQHTHDFEERDGTLLVMPQTKGRADGKKVNQLVKELLG